MLVATVAAAFAVIAASASPARDGAVIANSGSTNVSGYTISVWSDGAVSAQRSSAGPQTSSRISSSLVTPFFADLKQAKRAGSAAELHCMKSASFGSSTHVTYHGWTSPDLECPGAGPLATDVHAIVQAVALPAAQRRPMLPNEPRRPEGPIQATASPDSGHPMP